MEGRAFWKRGEMMEILVQGSGVDGGQVGLGPPWVPLDSLGVKGQGWHGRGAQGHQVPQPLLCPQ